MGKKDIIEKRLIAKNDVFIDIYNNITFHGNQLLDSASLVSIPTEGYARKQDGSWRQGSRDVLKADKQNHQYRLICGIENQENCDNTMPVRTMGYDYASYEEQIRQLQEQNRAAGQPAYVKGLPDHQKLAPVITTVLSFGKNWDGPESLLELLDFPEEYQELLKQLVPDYHLNLIRVDELPDEVISRLTSDFRFVAEYYAARKDPEKKKVLLADNTRKIQHPEELLEMLGEVTGDIRYHKLAEPIVERKGEDITMCTIADSLIEEGIERGIELGTELGMQRGLERGLELVKAMILNGEGALITELSVNKELLREMCEKYLAQ